MWWARVRCEKALAGRLGACLMAWQCWSLARVAHEGKKKSWREVVSKLTGRCSNAHANGSTHAGGAALSGAVDPIRIPVVATEHPLGQ